MPQVFLTLTTIPTRLQGANEYGFKSCVDSLLNQTYENYEIHFNIPDVNKTTQTPYIIPDWLNEISLKDSRLKIFRVEDLGPITKIVSTLLRVEDPDAIIITVDDDLVYNTEMVKEQVANQSKFPGCAIGYDGLGIVTPVFNDVRDHYVVSVNGNYPVKVLQAYKTISYRRNYFQQDYFTDFVGKSWNDDLVNAAYLASKNIKRVVTFHSSDPVLKTIEEWRMQGGVTTFPVLKHTHHDSFEGCNIMRQNKVDDNGSWIYKHIEGQKY